MAIARNAHRCGVSTRCDAMLSTAFCKCPGPDGILVEGETRVNGYKGWLMSAQSDAMRQAAFRTVQGGSIDGSACNSNHLVLYCMIWSGCREHELARIEDADRRGCDVRWKMGKEMMERRWQGWVLEGKGQADGKGKV